MLFDFGLNLTASYARQSQDNKNAWNIFGKVGYKFLEKHAASVRYGAEPRTYRPKMIKATALLWLTYFRPGKVLNFMLPTMLHMLDRDKFSDPDDINVGFVGGRVKF